MRKYNSAQQSENIACPNCGRHNPAWYASCEKCGARLIVSTTSEPIPSKKKKIEKRPSCLTIYAVLMGLAAALLMLGGVGYGFLPMTGPYQSP